mgnify:CR=1 FL=1
MANQYMQEEDDAILKTYNRYPVVLDHGDGAYLYDPEGKKYLDFSAGYAVSSLGYNNKEFNDALKAQIDKMIHTSNLYYNTTCGKAGEDLKKITGMYKVFFTNSGGEAIEGAIKTARKYAYTKKTGRYEFIAMENSFHGRSMGAVALTGHKEYREPFEPVMPGVHFAIYNDLDSVKALLEQAKGQVAAVIVEPVAANMGVVAPKKGFLEGLRTLCDQHGTLLIFDEVITGFRLAFGGAAEYFGVTPDMVTYGKIIGAGMPVGAYGGRREIMEMVSPAGPVYQAGTLSGNPIAMAAGLTQLKYLYEHQEVYKDLEEKGQKLYGGIEEILKEAGSEYHVNHVSSLGSLFFAKEEVVDYTSAKSSDTKAFADYFLAMLKQGIHLAPSQFEAMFLSTAHSDEVLEDTLTKIRNYFM